MSAEKDAPLPQPLEGGSDNEEQLRKAAGLHVANARAVQAARTQDEERAARTRLNCSLCGLNEAYLRMGLIR